MCSAADTVSAKQAQEMRNTSEVAFERILGMGIPLGKLTLYTAYTGVPPQMRLPVVLDCGTNNLADPFYISRRQKRVRGEKFEQLGEFMNAANTKYGG
ncbi:hypothetical protein PR003_g12186 [Phytophthora rubi]|uniref:Malic enzyme N-terminal domain-containing protein n=1 Tax=Phytophthora rubi TaxID=129364 RepID=A0A6A4FAL3_9STRA|nr:hypothetical protein PR003_g12186 [Phytophthora rubi]